MPYFGGRTHLTPQRLEIIPPGLQIMLRAAMSEESNGWTLVKRRRENAAAPLQLQLDDQERQRAFARRSAAKLVAKRSAKLDARQLQEDELRAVKEDELRLGLELQRAELE